MSAQPPPTPHSGGQVKAQRRDKREVARAVSAVVLAGVFIAFALLNLKQVRVDWIVGSGHAPLIIVIAISVLVGVVLTYLTERLSRKRRRR
ncbi:MAG TPA: LapA family protein [Solirubrobacteraceae bacterium]|nr:LapA family protein [Solirubrobacteraceae bacterium]